MKFSLNKDTLTLGDLDDFEQVSGQSLDRILEAFDSAGESSLGGLPVKSVMALLWVGGRQSDPTLTYEQVRALPIADLSAIEIDIEETADPMNASV